MDEKDLEMDSQKEQETPVDETVKETSPLDSVTYEDNDNWKFDGEAATLNDDLFEPDEKAEEAQAATVVDAYNLSNNDNYDPFDPEDPYANVTTPDTETEGDDAEGKAKSKVNKKLVGIIVAAVVAVAVIATAVVFGVKYFTQPRIGEKHINPGSVVATTNDGDKVSIGMFNYYYSSIVSYYEQYAAYGYVQLDTEVPYENQTTTDDEGNKVTWAEFFKNKALEELKYSTAFYNKGIEAGVELTEDQKKTIDDQIDSLQAKASEEKISADEYAQKQFGKYCGIETVRLMLEQYYITANYRGMYATQAKYSDKDVEKYLAEHVNDYKSIEFSYLAMDYDTTSEETKKASKEKAEKFMSKITDEKSVKELVPEVYKQYIAEDVKSLMSQDDSLTKEQATKRVVNDYKGSTTHDFRYTETPFDAETTAWLFDDNAKIGEKRCYVNEETGYIYIILKTELASSDDSVTYNVRHILITPEQDDTSTVDPDTQQVTYTDEQWKAAEKKANDLLKKFKKNKGDEYAFALLAEEKSADPGSTSASGTNDVFGGLYESVHEGDMVPEFEKWSLDPARKYGDTGVVKTDYGYHIMFFVSTDKSYVSQAKTDMRANELQAIVDNTELDIRESVIEKAMKAFNEAREEAKAEQETEDNADDHDFDIVADDGE